MTGGDERSSGWGRVASALGHEDEPADDPKPTSSSTPKGWDRIAAKQAGGAGPTDAAEPAPEKSKALPAGWGGVASKLGGAAAGAKAGEAEKAKPAADRSKPPTAKAKPTGKPKPGPQPPARTKPADKAKPTDKAKASGKAKPESKAKPADKAKPELKKTAETPAKTPLAERIKARTSDRPKDGDDAATAASSADPSSAGGDGGSSRPNTRLLAAGGGALAIVVAVVLVLVLVVFSGGGLTSKDAFSVNGHKTTIAEFNTQLKVVEQLAGVKAPAKTDKAAYAKFLQTAAQSQATQDMVTQLAAKNHVTYSQKQARDQLDQTVQQQYQGNEGDFEAALKTAGITEDEYLQYLVEQGVGQALLKKVTKAPKVTAAQITDTYNQNQSKLQIGETRALSGIEVADQTTAQNILTQLQGGADFATLAGQDSVDSSKSNGGTLGTFQKGQLPAALDGPTFGAQQGVPFGPIELSAQSWVIGEVTAITPPASYANDTQTQSGIGNWLNDSDLRTQWTNYLERELKSNSIKYTKTYQPAKPDTAPQAALPTLFQFVQQAHNPSSSSSSTGTSGTGSSASGATTTTPTTAAP